MDSSESRVDKILQGMSQAELQELRSAVSKIVTSQKPPNKGRKLKGVVIPSKLLHDPVEKVKQPEKVNWQLRQYYYCSLCRRYLNYNELSVHSIPLHDHNKFIYPLPPTVKVSIVPMGARSFQRKRSLSYGIYEAVKTIPMDELMEAVREVWSE